MSIIIIRINKILINDYCTKYEIKWNFFNFSEWKMLQMLIPVQKLRKHEEILKIILYGNIIFTFTVFFLQEHVIVIFKNWSVTEAINK